MNPEFPPPASSTALKNLLLSCAGQLKLLYREQPPAVIAAVNDTLDQITKELQHLDATPDKQARLLPLIPNSSNEGLANTLARLLVEDESQAETGAQGALFILTGIQAYLDSGGAYSVIEHAWEPCIVARQIKKTYGQDGMKKAAEMAAACRAVEDSRGAQIYERVTALLTEPISPPVDNPS